MRWRDASACHASHQLSASAKAIPRSISLSQMALRRASDPKRMVHPGTRAALGRRSAARAPRGRERSLDGGVIVRSQAITFGACLVRLHGDPRRVEYSLSIGGRFPRPEPRVAARLESVTVCTHPRASGRRRGSPGCARISVYRGHLTPGKVHDRWRQLKGA
jgi:hypothetical protein